MDIFYIMAGLSLGAGASAHILWAWKRAGRPSMSGWLRTVAVFALVQVPLIPEWLRANDRPTDGWLAVVAVALLLAAALYNVSTPNPFASAARPEALRPE